MSSFEQQPPSHQHAPPPLSQPLTIVVALGAAAAGVDLNYFKALVATVATINTRYNQTANKDNDGKDNAEDCEKSLLSPSASTATSKSSPGKQIPFDTL